MFSRAVGREGHCKQISLVCVRGTHSVPATLGLPLLMECVLSPSTLLRLQVALQGAGPKLHALSRPTPLSSGSWVLHKGAGLVGPVFCAFPIGAAQATRSLTSSLFSGAA